MQGWLSPPDSLYHGSRDSRPAQCCAFDVLSSTSFALDPRGVIGPCFRPFSGQKTAQNAPLRCEDVGEWGGSAHYPDPTAQSAPRAAREPSPRLAGQAVVERCSGLEVRVAKSLSCVAAFAAGKNGAPGAGTPYLRRAKYARLQRMAVSSDDTNAILASQDKREESMESSLRFSIHARSDNSHALTGLGYAMGLAA